MKKLFVSYEMACKLKNLGFDEECLGHYKTTLGNSSEPELIISKSNYNSGKYVTIPEDFYIDAPIYQQVIDWFEKSNILIEIEKSIDIDFYNNEKVKMTVEYCCEVTVVLNDGETETFYNDKTFENYNSAIEDGILYFLDNIEEVKN